MKWEKQHFLLYLVSLTVVITILLQLYWNYQNYQNNRQQLIKEIQECFDSSVDGYYYEITQNTFIALVDTAGTPTTGESTSLEFIESEAFHVLIQK